jgi:hypothetical protein
MGDANRRGTFEERKNGAITKQKIDDEREMTRKAEIEATKTPEQKLRLGRILHIALLS